MNKAITDGVVFQPPSFADGLDVWSSEDGTPGTDTYDNAINALFVPADQDFGAALEIQKVDTTTRVRYMGETPILPGCYLLVTARVKCLSGIFPNVRIGAWAGGAGGTNVLGVVQTGTTKTLDTYGEVVEVSAIIGTGARGGVDMVWGTEALYGHFGLDLTGPNGGVIRIDDIQIEDVSSAFLGDRLGSVDVLDYGAIPDGATDSSAAFEAADSAAQGREVYVPEGSYFLASDVTINNRVRFVGSVTMPDDKQLLLAKNYGLPAYEDAFGDEVIGFKKAFQVLMGFSDHESLDMGGRRIRLTEPLDMQAAVVNRTTFATRRVVRNGQIQCDPSADWDDTTVTSPGTYVTSNPLQLTDVTNAASVEVGSLVEGAGVGREVYVAAVNKVGRIVTLTQPLYGAAGTQSYTFRRFKYALDFSGWDELSQFVLDSVEIQCSNLASGILLPKAGTIFHVKDCFITRPKDRGITSAGTGCQGMMIDRCNWFAGDADLDVESRTTIGFNTNANDIKIRDNRIVRFKHFGIIGGGGSSISGNHYFLGDGTTDGVRKGGIVFASTNVKAYVTGNYIDNNFIEWTNEYEADPDFADQLTFGGLTITGNTFTVNDVAPWFRFIVVKPYGPGFSINGLAVIGNVFKSLNGSIDRVEDVDTSFADLNYNTTRNITFEANTFDGVTDDTFNPIRQTHEELSPQQDWFVEFAPRLPFGGRLRHVEAVVPVGPIRDGADAIQYDTPYVSLGQGVGGSQARVSWPAPMKGTIAIMARMDRPD
ncbi:MAG: right-handed parallel beta-helix repeat-containing protein [Rhodobacteraceae bacterium]|nr:right-handed parallel beta-helix repeat-containing protein [Paracoccaceae bacterium]